MKTSPPFVTIVSGSPRDGTAMVMQMLMAGGQAVLVDDVHKAGTPEPHGYFDYEPSLMLDVDEATKDWVAGAHGRAVKVMPYQLQYPTVFVRCRELIASPATQAPRLVDFLGLPLDVDAMSAAARGVRTPRPATTPGRKGD